MATRPPQPRRAQTGDRKSTRLNSSHTEIYTLSLHDALPIFVGNTPAADVTPLPASTYTAASYGYTPAAAPAGTDWRSEEHTSELQSHRDLHSFPTRRSSDLRRQHASGRRDAAACQHLHGGKLWLHARRSPGGHRL